MFIPIKQKLFVYIFSIIAFPQQSFSNESSCAVIFSNNVPIYLKSMTPTVSLLRTAMEPVLTTIKAQENRDQIFNHALIILASYPLYEIEDTFSDKVISKSDAEKIWNLSNKIMIETNLYMTKSDELQINSDDFIYLEEPFAMIFERSYQIQGSILAQFRSELYRIKTSDMYLYQYYSHQAKDGSIGMTGRLLRYFNDRKFYASLKKFVAKYESFMTKNAGLSYLTNLHTSDLPFDRQQYLGTEPPSEIQVQELKTLDRKIRKLFQGIQNELTRKDDHLRMEQRDKMSQYFTQALGLLEEDVANYEILSRKVLYRHKLSKLHRHRLDLLKKASEMPITR